MKHAKAWHTKQVAEGTNLSGDDIGPPTPHVLIYEPAHASQQRHAIPNVAHTPLKPHGMSITSCKTMPPLSTESLAYSRHWLLETLAQVPAPLCIQIQITDSVATKWLPLKFRHLHSLQRQPTGNSINRVLEQYNILLPLGPLLQSHLQLMALATLTVSGIGALETCNTHGRPPPPPQPTKKQS